MSVKEIPLLFYCIIIVLVLMVFTIYYIAYISAYHEIIMFYQIIEKFKWD